MTQLSLGALGGIQLAPDALEEQRGAWCSPEEYTKAAGVFDVDPFTNPRSTLVARFMCMLERSDDGFGHVIIKKPPRGEAATSAEPGKFYVNPRECEDARDHDDEGLGGGDGHPLWTCAKCGYRVADALTTVWIQPDYEFVLEALAHYGHTRFTALLRLDTSTVWFAQLWGLSEVIMVPKRDRLEFVPPPGVKPSSNPFPHGLYYKRAEDVTPAIAELCYPWPCPSYPWRADPLRLLDVIAIR